MEDIQIIFFGLYAAFFFLASAIRSVYARRYKQPRSTPDRTDRFLSILPVFGMLVLPLIYGLTDWLDFADYRLPAWAGWVGAALFGLADWLLWRSHADLGRQWSVNVELQQEHRLVTGGIFNKIRHPMYAAHLVWGLAQPLLLWNWLAGFSMLLFLVPLYLYRIPREEKMMEAEFGSEYRRYRQRTGRLFPKVF